ncbi:HAMP domain-containing sensor histidine kinase [Flavobacterium sp. DG1-102-2]|uniref:sensor histidine kinase n=1 Tax=Flavobacterium sp. DG1-102-2 TaxID=3081663 RepID=UPI00294984FB|nr:HAMP domain-containing sensor histidine kinase [Flavobacterium sp. DG1-102-2]MDV6167443.1 HAMP domain-containing sensor histidine kinase [Flavobacterium sp. DG1-102-2]
MKPIKKPASIKNRIALYNLISTALLILVVFTVIYRIVSFSVNRDINNDLQVEINLHTAYVAKQDVFIGLVDKAEWTETEHQEIVINPVFVQAFDTKGNSVEKSPNLKGESLRFQMNTISKDYGDTHVAGIAIRQVQSPLFYKGQLKGYVIIAMSIEQPVMVLDNLLLVLLVAYPVVLLILTFVTRIVAGQTIKPALDIIAATRNITDNNFNERIALPKKRDELYALSLAINGLLDRIENAIAREKQFTSDASHELRTPLAVIKGTLEVMIRKPRTAEEYNEKVQYCIREVNRLNHMVDQLLLMARFEDQKLAAQLKPVVLDEVILQALERYSPKIEAKNIAVIFDFKEHFEIISDAGMTTLIIENILSNAIKYSRDGGSIIISLSVDGKGVKCTIEDKGMGIAHDDLGKIYGQFYRSEALDHADVKGTGLGLSIVKRLCDLLSIHLDIKSTKDVGTTVTLEFARQ